MDETPERWSESASQSRLQTPPIDDPAVKVETKVLTKESLPALAAAHLDVDHSGHILKATSAGSTVSSAREPYKSYRKKYRKLRLRFDNVLRENEDLEILDESSKRTLRRLNAENARLLDMLIDLSESPHIDKQFRISGLGVDGGEEEVEREKKIALILGGGSDLNGKPEMPLAPQYLKDELELLQNDYDTDF